MEYTDNEYSPAVFRKWAGLAMASAALERRVWQVNSGKIVYPNLFTLLVGAPGVGKQIINEARELMREAKELGSTLEAFHVASDSLTHASLVDELGEAICLRMRPEGPWECHSLFIAAEEFTVLCPEYDMHFVSKMNSIWNNPGLHKEKRRTGSVKELKITSPQLNILAGIQPSVMAHLFPEEVWQTGIARRLLMIYSNEEIKKELFSDHAKPHHLREKLLHALAQLSGLFGHMKWEPQAASRLNDWYMGGCPPEPTHSKLVHYNRSRVVSIIKLCMVSACVKRLELVIRLEDVEQAMLWLLHAEGLMPDIFRSMVGKSDIQVLEELHIFAQQVWLSQKRPPAGVLPGPINHFLAQRVPSDKVERLLALAERAGFLKKTLTDGYIPQPKTSHGVE